MGQKVNPNGFRLKIINTWESLWYDDKSSYAAKLHEDILLRQNVTKSLHYAEVDKVIIARKPNIIVITIHSAKLGMIIGKRGDEIEKLKKKLSKVVGGSNIEFNMVEVKKPEMNASLIAQSIVRQLEKRKSSRKAMKKAIQSCMKVGGKGIKITCSGRLGGADIARTECYKEGRVPLHTLRANICYSLSIAKTTYGIIGVKVWVYTGDVASNNK